MNINISIKESKGQTIANVAGVTSALLLATRTGETKDRGEQISEITKGNLKLTVWWSLRETPDSIGRAAALPWESREEADHVELGMGSVVGTRVDAVEFLTHNKSLNL